MRILNYKNYDGNILPCNLIGFIIKILFAVLIIIHWSSVRHTTQRRKEIFCSDKSRIASTFWLSFRGRNVSKGLLPSPSLVCASSCETKSGSLRWLSWYMNPGVQYNLQFYDLAAWLDLGKLVLSHEVIVISIIYHNDEFYLCWKHTG